jgi:hypothetical protein
MYEPQQASSGQTSCPRCGHSVRYGERACSECGLSFDDSLKTKKWDLSEATVPSCHRCGKPHQPGDTVCAACGASFNGGAADFAPDDTNDFRAELAAKIGENFPSKIGISTFIPTTITLEINGLQLPAPTAEVIILGRGSQSDAQEVLVDLGPFGAGDKGVSRRHVIIRRRGTLIYVADIGSTNGTWHNGQRLVAFGERLLRDGDELQLSRLKLRVMCRSWE